jgi:flagellin
MLVVNTNVSSLKAQRELSHTRFNLSVAMQRISSGVKLNSSKDDPTGIGISQRMTSHIKGLSMAMQNANDGIGFLQTAEGALQEVTTLMQRMRELAVQATDGLNNSSDLRAMQNQIIEFNAEITRIAADTELNGNRLLNGDVVNAEFQVGIRFDQTIKVSIPGTAAKDMGHYSTSTNSTGLSAMGAAQLGVIQGEAPENLVKGQNITIRGFSSDIEASQIAVGFEESAKTIAERISRESGLSGVSATAKTTLTLEEVYNSSGAGTQSISFRLYGANVKQGFDTKNAANILANIEANTQDGLKNLVSAVNAETTKTGITATFVEDVNGPRIELVQEDGEDISIEGFSNTSENEDPLVESTMFATGFQGTERITLSEGASEDSMTVGGIVTFHSYKAFTVTSDAIEGESLFKGAAEGALQGAEFSSLSNVDLFDEGGAADALNVITSALDFVSSLRGELGSLQNRFESTVANLGSVKENAEAARGRVEDADFAEETAKLTKAQILQEAGIAILAQANTIPQTVLALLRA